MPQPDKYLYTRCPFCGGDGTISRTQDGQLVEIDCTKCNGTGQYLLDQVE